MSRFHNSSNTVPGERGKKLPLHHRGNRIRSSLCQPAIHLSNQVDPAFQILLLGLIRGVGGLFIAVALAMGILLFIPFRQGIRWARWAVPAVGPFTYLTILYPVLSVKLNTPANPPWIAIVFYMGLLVAGFIFSLEPEKKEIV